MFLNIIHYGIPDNSKLYKKEPEDKVIFSIIGTMDKRKGQDILIEAIKLLPSEYQAKIRVDFIGQSDNQYAEDIMSKAANLSCVNFKGLIHFEKKNELYKNTDVLICISRDDPFPVVVSEAMLFSIPCIISDHVGQANLIKNGFNGFVIQNENIEELKNKMIWCIDNRNKLYEIGCNSRRIYEEYASIDHFEDEFRKILCKNAVL